MKDPQVKSANAKIPVGVEKPAASKAPLAGGFFIAIGMLGGAGVGVAAGEPSAGMVIGLGLGVAVAALIWLLNLRT